MGNTVISRLQSMVSCVCISRSKPEILLRAISCFRFQSYPNRELLVIYDEHNEPTRRLLDTFQFDTNIRSLTVSSEAGFKLGALRNLGIEHAQGEFVCQWDDDDWYDSERIRMQVEVLDGTGYEASILTRWIVFDQLSNRAYLSNQRSWEGSLLCRRSLLSGKTYENIDRGEDTPIVDWLDRQGRIYKLGQLPFLYVYVYHGGNTWSRDHWENIFLHSTELGGQCTLDVSKALQQGHLDKTVFSLNALYRLNDDFTTVESTWN